MNTLEAKPNKNRTHSTKTSKLKARKSTVYIDCDCDRRPEANQFSTHALKKSSNSLVCFRCSNSWFLKLALLARVNGFYSPIANETRTPRNNCQDGHFSTSLTGLKTWVVQSIVAVHQRPRTPWNWRCSFAFSCLSFDISMKNTLQRWSSGARPVSEKSGKRHWEFEAMISPHSPLKAGPPWFEFLVIFDFFAPWYRRGWEASSAKIL